MASAELHRRLTEPVFRDFASEPMRAESTFFSETPNGNRIEMTFGDNDVLIGSTQSYPDDGQGFFLQPADPRSNNLSVFVTAAGMQQLRFL